jgi:hypothetical protein
LAPSTTSASSGFNLRQRRWNIDEEAQRFRRENPELATPTLGHVNTQDQNIFDPNGDLNEHAFRRRHPNFGSMLVDFVTMAIILLYYDPAGILRSSWTNSDILIILADKAIEIILKANATDTGTIAETCKYLISLLKELIYNYRSASTWHNSSDCTMGCPAG